MDKEFISSFNKSMSEAEAKNTIAKLTRSIINDKSGKKINRYNMEVYSNIINKNLISKWTKDFNTLEIILDDTKKYTVEFIVPHMNKNFVHRFVNGKETLNKFLRKSSVIKIKISNRIFETLKKDDDAYNFFKSAIIYYSKTSDTISNSLMSQVMKLGHVMKSLISNTQLNGIVTQPLTLLFAFNNIRMDDKEPFKISDDDIKTVNNFVRNITSRYTAPKNEKDEIIKDIKIMIKSLKENCIITKNIKELTYLPESVEKLYFNGFENEILEASRNFINEQIDPAIIYDTKLKYMRESFGGVKKLKKIPTDLVAYISIETEAIRDENDKMMISSYCLGKIEIVEWYIELLEVGTKKYIVPHTKAYLEIVRTQLLACFKKIMDTSISKADKPIIDIKYPKGYEG